MEGLLESMAEYYSANLSKHVKRGQRENSINGRFCGGTVTYGYRVEDHRLVIDGDSAPIVRRVFEQYDAGTPVTDICKELNAAGYRNVFGRPFTLSTIHHMLSNEKYIGIYRNGDLIVQDGCPPIVDADLWRRVKQRQDARKRRPAAERAKTRYLLSGKLFCGHCGECMNGESGRNKNNVVYNYYMCRKKKNRKGCSKRNEKKEFLEWYVVEQTILYVLQPDRMEYIAEQVVMQYNKEFGASKADELEKQRRRIEIEITSLVNSIAHAPEATQRRIFVRIEELEAQSTDLEISISKLRIAEQIRLTKEQVMAWLKTFCRGDLMDPDYQERIIDTFINAVYLYDDHIIIWYNVTDGKQISYMETLESTADFDVDAFPADVFAYHSPSPARNDGGRTQRFVFLSRAFGLILPLPAHRK